LLNFESQLDKDEIGSSSAGVHHYQKSADCVLAAQACSQAHLFGAMLPHVTMHAGEEVVNENQRQAADEQNTRRRPVNRQKDAEITKIELGARHMDDASEEEEEDEEAAEEAESEAVHEAVHTRQQGQTRSSAPSFSRRAPALVTGRPLVPGFDGSSAGPAGEHNLITWNVEVQTFRSPMEEQEEEGRRPELSESEFDNESPPLATTPKQSVILLSLDSVVPGVKEHNGVRQSACSEPVKLVKDCARKTRTSGSSGSTNPFWAFLHWHKAVSLLIQAETGLILSVFMEWRELSSAPHLAHAIPPKAMDGVIKDLVHDVGLALAVLQPGLMEPNNTPLLKQPIPNQYPSEATPPPGIGEDSRAQQQHHPRISRSWLSFTSLSSPTCSDGLTTHDWTKCIEANPTPLLKRVIFSQYPLSPGKKIEMNVNDGLVKDRTCGIALVNLISLNCGDTRRQISIVILMNAQSRCNRTPPQDIRRCRD
jgi:hypothetical protein